MSHSYWKIDDRQFEALFNYATIGIIVTDDHGVIVNFNKYAEVQFEYSKEEICGQHIEILIPQRLHAVHTKHRVCFYQHPEPRKMGEARDLYARKRNGVEFPVEVSLSHYTLHEETSVIAFVIDITIRKRSEELVLQQNADLERITSDIRQLNAQLEQMVDDRTRRLRATLAELEESRKELSEALVSEKELGELKSRFVTMASHEFRTPLSTILSSAYLLSVYNEEEYGENKSRHIERITRAVEGLKGILEDFLCLGRLQEGKMQAVISQVEAKVCVASLQSVITDMRHFLKAGQEIRFVQALNGDSLWTDLHLLKNIFTNLISNAIKFSGENKVVLVSFILSEDTFSLSVRDNGIGIAEDEQDRLFTCFFRARNAANIEGTGLGLHIISKYLELLNGTIYLQSRLNEGSCFTIRFSSWPIKCNHHEEDNSGN